MSTFLFSNTAITTLAIPLGFTETTMQIAFGTDIFFPNPGVNQQLALVLNSATLPGVTEIVYCTQIFDDVLTIVRAQEGTVARNWELGDYVANLMTAGTAQNFVQLQSGTTSQRPYPTAIGQFYYDTTLGYPIYCNELIPSIVWHNAQGVPV